MVEHPLTLMVVHAHPDDEASTSGGILAKYAAEGVRTVLVTCTDGACGDGPDGVKPGEPGHDIAAVVKKRRAELDESCAILKVNHLEVLEYPDSGMMGWPQNDAPGSFWTTPVPVVAERLAGLIRQYRPDVVVTYDENGFYGHPDHIQAHRVTMAAIALTDIPSKVYWITIPRSTLADFEQAMRDAGAEWDETPDPAEPEMGLPDEEVTTWVDIASFVDQKYDALAAHASQPDNAFFLGMGRETFARIMSTETFVRVHDATKAPVPEDDLFAGLRGV
jgi:LmbE family N-acetylglucosaminyl deacetylase